MRNERHAKGNGYFPFGAIVLAFMGLSLAITATGTARFAVAMRYPREVGYAVGAVFDFAKALLLSRYSYFSPGAHFSCSSSSALLGRDS